MKTAKIFQNGQSQAVRLPKEFRLPGDEVFIKHHHGMVVLIPKKNGWDALFQSLTMFSDDFMSDREQPPAQEREAL